MVDQDIDDVVEILKVLDVDLGEPALGKIMKSDLEALVDVAADWSAGLHVGLHTHQEHGVEAFDLAV